MKDRIICLVGASGSGKTTIAKELEKMGCNVIKSYTTREPREENEWGHIFIDRKDIRKDIMLGFEYVDSEKEKAYYQNDMIALKVIYDNIYFATKEQYQGKGTSIYIIDPEGAKQVQENAKDAEIVTVFLIADREVRCERLLRREYTFNKQHPPMDTPLNLKKKAVGRLIEDLEIFKICKCDYAVDANREIDYVVADVLEIIE